MLDTGAAYSMLDVEVADALGLFQAESISDMRIDSRLGSIPGRLVRTPLTLLAEEGSSLEISATVFVSEDWRGINFIGYGGFLERLRFAIDPGPGKNDFHFGRAD